MAVGNAVGSDVVGAGLGAGVGSGDGSEVVGDNDGERLKHKSQVAGQMAAKVGWPQSPARPTQNVRSVTPSQFGMIIGDDVGCGVGAAVGCRVGDRLGPAVGPDEAGDTVGAGVGFSDTHASHVTGHAKATSAWSHCDGIEPQ